MTNADERVDSVVKTGKMLLRLGFVVAIVLGLGMMFGWFSGSMQHVHMLFGAVALIGGWLVALGSRSPQRAAVRWIAALLLLAGAVVGIMMMMGNYLFAGVSTVHWITMLIAIALAEMGGRG